MASRVKFIVDGGSGTNPLPPANSGGDSIVGAYNIICWLLASIFLWDKIDSLIGYLIAVAFSPLWLPIGIVVAILF